MSTYWPGTNIIKSQGNAFDWRRGSSIISKDKFIRMSEASTGPGRYLPGQYTKSFCPDESQVNNDLR